MASKNGLLQDEHWVSSAVKRYLSLGEENLRLISCLFLCLPGQGPRTSELFTLECTNGPATWRGIYVYNGYMMYISRYHKSRNVTDRDFQVVRYLPYEAGRLVYYYLVYIWPFQDMLRRVCKYGDGKSNKLFSIGRRALTATDLTLALRESSKAVFDQPIGVKLYGQLSIAITEKHIRRLSKPFDLDDDRSPAADPDVVFA